MGPPGAPGGPQRTPRETPGAPGGSPGTPGGRGPSGSLLLGPIIRQRPDPGKTFPGDVRISDPPPPGDPRPAGGPAPWPLRHNEVEAGPRRWDPLITRSPNGCLYRVPDAMWDVMT